MKRTRKCPKCGGTDIVADAKVIDRGDMNHEQEMTLATFQNPDALIFKGKQHTVVSAWVCAKCGYTEFYADNPGALKLPKN